MVLAVIHDHANVVHRITGERSLLEHLAYAFFDCRYELRRYRPALDLVDELESRAALERLDFQEHFAELARAAGLFLVSMMPFGAGGDRLAIRDFRRSRVDFGLVSLGHLLEHDAQVQFAEAEDHRLVGVNDVLDLEARVLGGQLRHDFP